MTKRSIMRVSLVGILALLITSFAPTFLDTNSVSVEASSHREAPLISQDPTADATDFYMFVSPDRPDNITFIMNWIPYENPAGGPNFYKFGDDVLYELHIDNDGDALEDITYEFEFNSVILNKNTFLYNTGAVGGPKDPTLNVRQFASIVRKEAPANGSCNNTPLANCETAIRIQIAKDKQVAPANVGPKSMPVYPLTAQKTVVDLAPATPGAKFFAGPRADPFFADIGALFDLLTIRKLPGNAGGGVNTFEGYNVHTIGLQASIGRFTANRSIPKSLTDPNAVIGAWITSSRRTTTVLSAGGVPAASGPWVQIQRLGMPLVNEVVVPLGLKDAFGNLKPKDDAIAAGLVTDPEPARLLKALYKLPVPPTPRNDVVQVFLTGVKGLNQPAKVKPSEQLRLNVAVPPTKSPKRMGVLAGDLAGFPNGRRIGDDVIDASLQVLQGVLVDPKKYNVPLGDGVDAPARAKELMPTFPYLVLPYSGYLYGTDKEEGKQK